MKFSERWLREWVNPPVTTDSLVAQLTDAGLEVASREPVAGAMTGVVVGEVLEVRPHPNAERLHLCQVNLGTPRPVPVVCGAPNVRAGLRAPLACVGARLPDGRTIEATSVRGMESQGMLCSAKELGLAEQLEGLLELPEDAPVGTDLADYLGLDDVSIDVDLTPNRGDCLSIAGIAREVGVLNRQPIQSVASDPVPSRVDDRLSVVLEAAEDCPHYVGRILRNVDVHVATPLWLRERLRRSGVRSLGPVVDVTNYVMLELGQPMHAFDLDRLDGGVRVRRGCVGETLQLLDGSQVDLDAETLVIADHRHPVALAGIMGGAASAVSATTRHLFLESAFFKPRALAGMARRYGLHTDSSHRFERGVDPALQRVAMERATHLLLMMTGGEPGPIVEESVAEAMPRAPTIYLRQARVSQLLGMPIPAPSISDTLERLGMTVVAHGEGWQVTPPCFRFDIEDEADLIEEVARIRGYQAIPENRPRLTLGRNSISEQTVELGRVRQSLVERGYTEAITYSFVDTRLQALMDPDAVPMRLANPLSTDMAVMRTNLWPGLMQVLLHNSKRQQARVRVFETGLTFRSPPPTGELRQEAMLGGLVSGPVYPEQWGLAQRDSDFFDVKSDVEALLSMTAKLPEFRFTPVAHGALHPGQAAEIHQDGRTIGILGALHPRIVRELKLARVPLVFELRIDSISVRTLPTFQPPSRFPRMRRDIAIVVDESVRAQAVADCIRSAATTLLADLDLFDVYRGEGIDPGKKSLALGLIFQAPSRTLNDDEVDGLVAAVVNSLGDGFGAILRS
ncbi:MAG: phenylalanine--tRNA ligase subunit beta [Gammaproteobacteria bacterium]